MNILKKNRKNLISGIILGSMLSAFSSTSFATTEFGIGHFSSSNPQTYEKMTGSLSDLLEGEAEVKFISMPSAPQMLAAMASGSIDTASIGSSPIITAIEKNLDISIVYIQKVINKSEALVINKDSDIHSVADLKGKKIGVPYNTSAHFALMGALDKAGLSTKDVTLINMKPDALMATWSRHDIDAAYIWHPFLGDLEKQNGEVIFSTEDLKSDGVLVFDALIVRNEFKKAHPDIVLKYIQDQYEISQRYKNDTQSIIDDFSKYLRLPEDKTRLYVSNYETLTLKEMLSHDMMGKTSDATPGLLNSLTTQAQFLKDADQIKEIPTNLRSYIDSSFVEKLAEIKGEL